MIAKTQTQKVDRSLENSHISRNGLPRGVPAPVFCLPRLDGTLLSLTEYRGQRVLLVFSDPNCDPCEQLAPQLEQLHRCRTDLQVLMISRGDLQANLAKVADYKLTFPIVLQRRWEVSREYGIFATPVGYLLEKQGAIASDVAVGGDAILALVTAIGESMRDQMQTRLQALRTEFETGRGEIERVEHRRAYLRDTMLRISGAIQVLEELLVESQSSGGSVVSASDTPLAPAQTDKPPNSLRATI